MLKPLNPIATELKKLGGLTLKGLAAALQQSGIITAAQARELYPVGQQPATATIQTHPIILIAERRWLHTTEPRTLISIEYLCQWLADLAGIGYLRIDPLKIDVATVTTQVSQAYANRHHILPLEVGERALLVATAEPFRLSWVEELAKILHKQITPVMVNPLDLNRYLDEFYKLSHSIKKAGAKLEENQTTKLRDLEQLMELGGSGHLDANNRHIVSIVDWLLQYAFTQRASDIHIEPRREQGNVRFRIDGNMQTVYSIPPHIVTAVTSRLKILGRMDVAEKRRPQDGRIKSRTPDGAEFELRLSTMPTAFGEKLVMRIFNPQVVIQSFNQLGLGSEIQQRWSQLLQQQHGILLVTGPTGSGKTTTLYSSLKRLATPEVNVCTVEDPIENVMEEFNQMQVMPEIGIDFASGIRTLLRQDPDVIMVGEIRDAETANMAIQAALTGHLVLSTLHTHDSTAAIMRLIDIGVADYQIRASLLGVLAQRLLRRLCTTCKAPATLDEEEWQRLIQPWKLAQPNSIFRAVGCDECRHTGYLGRVGIYELLTITPEVSQLITPETSQKTLRHQAIRQGLQSLRLAAALKLAEGVTSYEEILRILPS